MQAPITGTSYLLITALEVMAALFIFVIGSFVLWLVIAFIHDITQTHQAIRRNYPVIGRFRYVFERLGGFFRQYFFAMDREELPFNRAQRSWIYRAAKNLDNTVAFCQRKKSPGRSPKFVVSVRVAAPIALTGTRISTRTMNCWR